MEKSCTNKFILPYLQVSWHLLGAFFKISDVRPRSFIWESPWGLNNDIRELKYARF